MTLAHAFLALLLLTIMSCTTAFLGGNARIFASNVARTLPATTPLFCLLRQRIPAFASSLRSFTSTSSASVPASSRSSSFSSTSRPRLASIIPTPLTLSDERQSAFLFQSDELVAFPTETVYGLGGNALSAKAVSKIFETKGRPHSSPLIVHVLDIKDALPLTVYQSSPSAPSFPLFKCLTSSFWPGPLTVIVPSSPLVPPLVHSNSGFVALRSPQHPISRSVLSAAGVPIAAPSANRFGHVSPTRARHVLDDLGEHRIWVVDGEGDCAAGAATAATERGEGFVGIESTVLQLSTDGKSATLLRHGAITESMIKQSISAGGLGSQVSVLSPPKPAAGDRAAPSPGQTSTHYAPDVPAFLVSSDLGKAPPLPEARPELRSSVVVDFGRRLEAMSSEALAYRDLSPGGSLAEAFRNTFDHLRWAEGVPGARAVLLPDLRELAEGNELARALEDKLRRAASGRRVAESGIKAS